MSDCECRYKYIGGGGGGGGGGRGVNRETNLWSAIFQNIFL